MYVPPHFREDDPTLLMEVLQRHSFAMLVSNLDGAPFATHLPLKVRHEGATLRIDGHFARANPHWQALEIDPNALVIFQGPHTYISPALYQSSNRVPTWNYVAVHATGRVRVDHSADAKLATLQQLIAQYDPGYQTQFDAIDGGLRDGLLNAIVAFELTVDKLEGKFKLGQNRLADNKPEMQRWHEQGGENERELAQWMKRLGHWS